MLKAFASGGAGKTKTTKGASPTNNSARLKGRPVANVPATRSWRVFNLTRQYGTQGGLNRAAQQGIIRKP